MAVFNMYCRYFSSLIGSLHNNWAGKVLGMEVNSQKGPDLIDEYKVAEVKFKLIIPRMYVHRPWTVLGHQMDYNKLGKDAFWVLGFYTLKKNVCDIKNRDAGRLESFVCEREAYIVKWNWMNRFSAHQVSGETIQSKWKYEIRHGD